MKNFLREILRTGEKRPSRATFSMLIARTNSEEFLRIAKARAAFVIC
jgi:hypothetical protein